jgi:hypothetical protein
MRVNSNGGAAESYNARVEPSDFLEGASAKCRHPQEKCR